TGHATALAPANAGRTAGGESKTYHHRQAPADSIPCPHSLSSGGGPDPNPASFSIQATTLGLYRTGIGNPHHWRTPLRKMTTTTFHEPDLDSWLVPALHQRFELSVQ